MSEQALGWFPLDLGLVMEDEPSKCSCNQDRCNLKHIESVAAPATYMYECTVNFNQEIFQTLMLAQRPSSGIVRTHRQQDCSM